MREADARVLDLAPAGLAAQLRHQLVDLREAGGAGRVAARDQPAVGVERDAAAERGLLLLDELLRLALGAEAEQLVVLELLVGEGVVAERRGRRPRGRGRRRGRPPARCRGSSWPGPPRGRRRCGPACTSRSGARTRARARAGARAGARAPARARRGSRTRRRRRPGRPSSPSAARRSSRTRAPPPAVTRWSGWRSATRTERAVVPVLRGDLREVLGLRAALVHAAHRPEREVGGRQDHRVDRVAADAAARPRRPRAISLILSKPSASATLRAARRDGVRRLAERHEPGGRRVLDVRHRQAGEPELLHRLDAEHRSRLDVADERLVRRGAGRCPHPRARAGPPRARARARSASCAIAEAHLPDPEHGDVLELHARGLARAGSGRSPPLALRRLAHRLELELHRHADARSRPAPPDEHGLDARSLGQVHLADAVAARRAPASCRRTARAPTSRSRACRAARAARRRSPARGSARRRSGAGRSARRTRGSASRAAAAFARGSSGIVKKPGSIGMRRGAVSAMAQLPAASSQLTDRQPRQPITTFAPFP